MMFEVTLTLDGLEGDDHEDAARTFVGVVSDWLAGGMPLMLDVTDNGAFAAAGRTRTVEIDGADALAFLAAEKEAAL